MTNEKNGEIIEVQKEKKMKKILSILLMCILSASFVFAGGSSETTSTVDLTTPMTHEELVAAAQAEGTLLDTALRWYEQNFDASFGGFGGAPKFPTPHNLLFLMQQYEKHGNCQALKNALLPEQSTENILSKQLAYMAGEAEQSPAGFSVFLMALSDFLEPPVLITVVPSGEALSDLPFAVPSDAIVKVLDCPLEGYKLLNDETTFYVCRNQSCLPPMNKRQLMMEILKRDQS